MSFWRATGTTNCVQMVDLLFIMPLVLLQLCICRNAAWSLESLASVQPLGTQGGVAVDPSLLAASFNLPAGTHVLPEVG